MKLFIPMHTTTVTRKMSNDFMESSVKMKLKSDLSGCRYGNNANVLVAGTTHK